MKKTLNECRDNLYIQSYYSARSYRLQPNSVHAFSYDYAVSEPIWMKPGALRGWPWHILARSAQSRERKNQAKLYFCQVN